MSHYEFDRNLIVFRKATRSIWGILKTALKYLVGTMSLAILYYAIFCTVISTDKEKILRKENKLYRSTYSDMVRRQKLVAEVIEGLEAKDADIYSEIFHTTAPSLFSLGDVDFLAQSDTVPDSDIVLYAQKKISSLEAASSRIEDNLRFITEALSPQSSKLPMCLPLQDMSYAQTGASVGKKINPIYKVESQHDGMDFIAPQGQAVVATADGTVTSVIMSRKGLGNIVEITHEGGYVTRYAHVSDISVRKGQNVTRGKKIAAVGIASNSIIPHLHYEILKDGQIQDPVNYFFATVDPFEYAEILYMATSTTQSMD